jgi:NADH-quinone oxidoreductase subunit L
MLFGDFFGESIFVLPPNNVLAELGRDFHGPWSFLVHGLASPVVYLALSGVVVAWYLYLHRPALGEGIRERLGLVYTVLVNKYYFDAFNEKVIAPFCTRLGKLLWRAGDMVIIDGVIVNGSARLVGWTSSVLRQIQTGYLYTYAFAMIIALSLMLGWLLLQP